LNCVVGCFLFLGSTHHALGSFIAYGESRTAALAAPRFSVSLAAIATTEGVVRCAHDFGRMIR
jgi:hypothetical protein